MFNNKEAHFAGDYLFQTASFSTSTQTSGVFQLGTTEGGLRIRGYIDGGNAATGASGATITTTLQVADAEDATAWTNLESKTFTNSSTAFDGDFFSLIPDTDKLFMRAVVANSTAFNTSGAKFTVAIEYVPR